MYAERKDEHRQHIAGAAAATAAATDVVVGIFRLFGVHDNGKLLHIRFGGALHTVNVLTFAVLLHIPRSSAYTFCGYKMMLVGSSKYFFCLFLNLIRVPLAMYAFTCVAA